MCAGGDWQAAEEAGPQSDVPGWRSVLHQQEAERRMAQPLEDGGGRETGPSQWPFIPTISLEAFISFSAQSEQSGLSQHINRITGPVRKILVYCVNTLDCVCFKCFLYWISLNLRFCIVQQPKYRRSCLFFCPLS